MTSDTVLNVWNDFLTFMKKKCSPAEYDNWIVPIKCLEITEKTVKLEVPNIFVQQYLMDNYKKELSFFFPNNTPAIEFIIKEPIKTQTIISTPQKKETVLYNNKYTFENFIEGPSNQFVKSAALGVANNPGKSFNPLFIHGGVGLGKTHLLHGIGNYIKRFQKHLQCKCITTEYFINDIVNHLRSKSIDKFKKYYRRLDILLVDDIQFLQNRQNFEEEFCNTFEALINQNKQIVITSDNPPSKLTLSQRMVARMEWGLVAHIGMPELETRVAIIQQKSHEMKVSMSNEVAFFIAEHIYSNVRQLEGAINRLCAYCKLLKIQPTIEIAQNILHELFQYAPKEDVTVENILKCVASVFELRVSDLKGNLRLKNIAFAR